MSISASDAPRATLLGAIRIETRNAAIYDSLSQLFEGYDESVWGLFREMAEEERQHQAELEKRYVERFGAVPAQGAEPRDVIEAPDLEDPEALIFDSMTLEQGLEMGLRAEEMAREFYAREVSRAPDPGLEAMYRELSEFEQTHVERLESKLVEYRRGGDPHAR